MTLEATIDAAWEVRDTISTTTQGTVREAVEAAISALDGGGLRVAEPDGSGIWRVNQWLKKAVLLSFRLNDNAIIQGPGAGTATANWFDKVPSKFAGWGDDLSARCLATKSRHGGACTKRDGVGGSAASRARRELALGSEHERGALVR